MTPGYKACELCGSTIPDEPTELDRLREEVARLTVERDHFRDAWAAAQVRLDCGVDATEAVREERAAVVAWLRGRGLSIVEVSAAQEWASRIERGEHRREEAP